MCKHEVAKSLIYTFTAYSYKVTEEHALLHKFSLCVARATLSGTLSLEATLYWSFLLSASCCFYEEEWVGRTWSTLVLYYYHVEQLLTWRAWNSVVKRSYSLFRDSACFFMASRSAIAFLSSRNNLKKNALPSITTRNKSLPFSSLSSSCEGLEL